MKGLSSIKVMIKLKLKTKHTSNTLVSRAIRRVMKYINKEGNLPVQKLPSIIMQLLELLGCKVHEI
jgi:hypothetical protein